MPNIGEDDELTVLKKLITLKGKEIPSFGIVSKVADYRGYELINSKNVSKAPSSSKRDVIINGKGYSIKSVRAAPSAIVNHTTREKWIEVCKRLNLDIALLDNMVSEYWNLRTKGEIGEDIWTSDKICPFGNTEEKKEYLKVLINYFLFKGSGKGNNPYPADYILEIDNPNDEGKWKVLDKETAFNKMWPHIKFSMRSKKGMPPNYPDMKNIKKKKDIEPWVKFIDGNYRGALHIRTEGTS